MAAKAYEVLSFLVAKGIAASTDLGNQIYVEFAPQSVAYPYAVLSIVSGVMTPTQSSGSAVDIYRVQVDVFSQADNEMSANKRAHTIAFALRTAWTRQSDLTTYTYDIDSVQEEDHRTEYIQELEVFRVSNDYMVRIK